MERNIKERVSQYVDCLLYTSSDEEMNTIIQSVDQIKELFK